MKKCSMIVVFTIISVLIISVFSPNNAIASDDPVSNMFIGEVNGESIVAYLDYTYATYYNDGFGNDVDATFICFDSEGKPQYDIGIRLSNKTKPGTYDVTKKVIDYVSIHLAYNEDTCKFADYYRVVEGATDWTVNFDEIDWNSGIIKGSVSGTLLPSEYNRSPYPTRSSVRISGYFEFQLKTIHPYMEEYRIEHTDYAASHNVDYVQSVGSPTISISSFGNSKDNSKQTTERVCNFCHGTKKCHACNGWGYTVTGNSYNHSSLGGVGTHKCSICNGSGQCTHCK